MKGYKIIIVILVMLIIGAIATGIILLKNDNRNEKNDKNTTNEIENISKEEFVEMVDDEIKLNISTKLNEPKTINGIEIKNIQLTYKNGMTVLLADITNNSGKDLIDVTEADIILLDKNNDEIITVVASISPTKVGETTQLNTSMTLDYVNAYDFRVVFK